jgi:hypothetical protein
MKNIFIVGATNQIGHFLLPMLKDSYNIFALSRKKHEDTKINWIQSDIKELDESIIDSLNINILIYIGSMGYVGEFLNKFKNLNRVILFSSTSAITKKDSAVEDEKGNILQESFYTLNGSRNGLIKNIVKNSYLGCTMAFNRKILDKSLPFPKDLPMHDWWIGLIGEIYGKTYFIEDKLISYRRHGNNASPTGEKSKYSFSKKIMFRLIIIKNLIWRYIK